MHGTGHWQLEGMSNPPPKSLKDLIFCWLLLGLFPEFSVADGYWSLDPKDSSWAAVHECPDLECCSPGSRYFSFIQQDRFYCGVEDPDLDVDGQVRWGPLTGVIGSVLGLVGLGVIERLIYNFYPSVAVCTTEQSHPWDSLVCCWSDKQPANKQT